MSRDDDHDRPTPRTPTTGTWEIYHERSRAYASRLRRAADAKVAPGASSNARLYDPEGAGKMRERADMLDWMADQFGLWPSDPEKWSVERVSLGPLFVSLMRRSEEEFLKMPRLPGSGAW